VTVSRRHLALGGVLSGFFGGLSGNQGAFRSVFLLQTGLDKQAFVATGVVCPVIIDVVRLVVYGVSFGGWRAFELPAGMTGVVGAATVAAFLSAPVCSWARSDRRPVRPRRRGPARDTSRGCRPTSACRAAGA
jgi:hypothetical protein